jgi:hypothetical protein
MIESSPGLPGMEKSNLAARSLLSSPLTGGDRTPLVMAHQNKKTACAWEHSIREIGIRARELSIKQRQVSTIYRHALIEA